MQYEDGKQPMKTYDDLFYEAYNSFDNKQFSEIALMIAVRMGYYNKAIERLLHANDIAYKKEDYEAMSENNREMKGISDFIKGFFKGIGLTTQVGIDKKFGKYLENCLDIVFGEIDEIPQEIQDACDKNNLLERPDYLPPDDPYVLYALILIAKYWKEY